jgi:outer membrane protein OmpA-like peptidoglycan-associated protein
VTPTRPGAQPAEPRRGHPRAISRRLLSTLGRAALAAAAAAWLAATAASLAACGPPAAPRSPADPAATAADPTAAAAAPSGRGVPGQHPSDHAPDAPAPGEHAADTPPWRSYVPVRCRDGSPPPAEGCRPRRVVVTSTDIEILSPVAFVDNTAELAPSSERIIDAVARSLINNPSILVLEVRGHSDSLLYPAERADLARKRADVVAARLVAQGVDPARVTTYGASDSELLYPPDDPRNRRVEFLIVARDE